MTKATSRPLTGELLPPERTTVDPLLEQISEWMDSKFEIPGLRWRFGLDALLGLVPGIGDTVTFAVSCYIIWAAAQHGASAITIARMGMNVGVDLAIGSIPLIGDVFDVAWKSNVRNVELLRRTLNVPAHARRRAEWFDWLVVIGGTAVLFVALVSIVLLTWTAVAWVLGQVTDMLSG
jgi:hypothetical protein